jgi:hypothetical protein
MALENLPERIVDVAKKAAAAGYIPPLGSSSLRLITEATWFLALKKSDTIGDDPRKQPQAPTT